MGNPIGFTQLIVDDLLGNLIENGGLKPQSLAAVVDKNLIRYTGEVHGVPIAPPEMLARLKPDIVVVLSPLIMSGDRSLYYGRLIWMCRPTAAVRSLAEIPEVKMHRFLLEAFLR